MIVERIFTKCSVSLLDGINRETGEITQVGLDITGQNIANKEFRFEASTGSTVGVMTLLELKENGVAPKKIILGKPDSNVIAGCILAGIPIEIEGMMQVDLPESELKKIENIPDFLARILVSEAKIVGAKGFIHVDAVQISGVSYKTIGDAGLKMLRFFAEKKLTVKVPTTLNPAGMDLKEWKSQGIPHEFAEKQLEIIEIFKQIGASLTVSCIPYDIIPLKSGSHLAFGESSAVSFVNSVRGCYTNRENPIKGLIAALTGFTIEYGMHLIENRKPDTRVRVECSLKTESDHGALGYYVGKFSTIPVYEGITPNHRELKAIAAAGAASGAIPLFYVKGIHDPPEMPDDLRVINFTTRELKEVYDELNTTSDLPDLIAVGCPHFNLDDLKALEPLLKGKRMKIPFWINTASIFKEQAEEIGLKERLETTGVHVYSDCCMVVAPIEKMNFRITATNSAKAAKYLKTFCKQEVIFKPLVELIKIAEGKNLDS
ncbi:MAG: aconitase X [Candidatus Helarchaeota archaeon]